MVTVLLVAYVVLMLYTISLRSDLTTKPVNYFDRWIGNIVLTTLVLLIFLFNDFSFADNPITTGFIIIVSLAISNLLLFILGLFNAR